MSKRLLEGIIDYYESEEILTADGFDEAVIGIDEGGTHTDLVASDGHGIRVAKVRSIPAKPFVAINSGLEMIAKGYGMSVEELVGNCDRVIYSSTMATNMFVQHKIPKVGLITTKGHRDSLWFRDGYKPERWNWHYFRTYSFLTKHASHAIIEIDSLK